jgi:hypothetical protein
MVWDAKIKEKDVLLYKTYSVVKSKKTNEKITDFIAGGDHSMPDHLLQAKQ